MPLQAYKSDAVPDQGKVKPQTTIPSLALAGAKGLDEQGLDNRAFLELQRELQRHEASDAEGFDENHDRHTEIDHNGMAARTERRKRHGRPETPDWSSGAATPVTDGGTSESGSYDPHNDSDLDHIELMTGEVDGLPGRIKKKKGEEESKPSGWAKLRGLLVKPQDTNEEDAMESQREKTYEEGGPTNLKSVPVTTSSGTRPGGPRSRPNKFEKEAARLVRAHRLMTGQGTNDDGEALSGMGGIPTMRKDHLESGATTPDRLDTQANLSARPVQSGGILGNLLKLYEQQQREERARQKQSGFSSEATSPLSTPANERAPGRDGNLSSLVAGELQRENRAAAERGSAPLSVSSVTTPRRRSWAPGASPSGWTSNVIEAPVKQIAGASKKVLSAAAKETGLEDAVDERPKASRSAAGYNRCSDCDYGELDRSSESQSCAIGSQSKEARLHTRSLPSSRDECQDASQDSTDCRRCCAKTLSIAARHTWSP